MPTHKALALATILLLAPLAHAKTCTPQAFGAKADGATPDTAAIQKAIDICSGVKDTVEFTDGTYLSAPLTLHSHTHLKLDEGATLLGSTNVDDYPVRPEPNANWRRTSLLHADNATDISITGPGIIDGQGKQWWDMSQKNRGKNDTSGNAPGFTRPMLVDLVKCTHILFDNVTLQNSPMYNIALFESSDITVTHVHILNPQFSHNTDGIDPFYSSHIRIEDTTFDTGDDGVAIKSGLVERGDPNLPSFDITIRNCTILHGHGISVGSELAGGVHDVTVDNVSFTSTDAGIRIKSSRGRGNDIYNLHYSNLIMKDVTIPIEIAEYYPEHHTPVTDTPQPMAEHTPRFHDITINNITATGAKIIFLVAGLPESPIRNLSMENVTLSGEKGGSIQQADITQKNVTITTPIPVDKRQGVNITEVK